MEESKMKNDENKVRNGWEALYDFLNEIFATMIPGGFFLSFFFAIYFIAAPTEIVGRINVFSDNLGTISIIVIGSIAYCFGAVFQRKQIKKVDMLSARYLYRNSEHKSGHSLAFANALTRSYIDYVYVIIWSIRYNKRIDKQKIVESILNEIRNLPPEEKLIYMKTNYLSELCRNTVSKYLILDSDSISTDFSSRLNELDKKLKNAECLPFSQRAISIIQRTIKNEREIISLDQNIQDEKSNVLNDKLDKILKEMRKKSKSKLIWPVCYDSYPVLILKRLRVFRLCKNPIYKKLWKVQIKIHDAIVSCTENDSRAKELLKRMYEYINSDLLGNIDWPYTHMYSYCKDRGLSFAKYVDWGDGAIKPKNSIEKIGLTTNYSYSDEINRSKSRLNTLKMDIGIKNPSFYRTISKTEAHIRFINSIWYAKNLLLWIICLTFCLTAAICVYHYFCYNSQMPFVHWIFLKDQYVYTSTVLACAVYGIICHYIKRSTLQILHYQRVREITLILEAKQLCDQKKKS